MESGHLPDSALSASTSENANYIPQFSRLNRINTKGKAGAWCANKNDGNQWLQVYFGRETAVTKVATQGRYDGDQWLMSYSLSYSVDGTHWAWYRLADGHIKVISATLAYVSGAKFSNICKDYCSAPPQKKKTQTNKQKRRQRTKNGVGGKKQKKSKN